MVEQNIKLGDNIIVLRTDPPTVDIKSKNSKADNSGNIVLNPPPSQMGTK